MEPLVPSSPPNIIITDIHVGNVLFRLPESERSSCNFSERFGSPLLGKVARKDGAPLEKGLPEYLVEPVEYDRENFAQLEQVQLVDFGEGIPPHIGNPH